MSKNEGNKIYRKNSKKNVQIMINHINYDYLNI